MTRRSEVVDEGSEAVPEPQGRFAGVPYDFRRPTLAKLRSRWWNPADERVLTPKTFGAGWDVNLYRLIHPTRHPKGEQ